MECDACGSEMCETCGGCNCPGNDCMCDLSEENADEHGA